MYPQSKFLHDCIPYILLMAFSASIDRITLGTCIGYVQYIKKSSQI